MPSSRDDDRARHFQLRRITPATLQAALGLLRLLAEDEGAALPRCFRDRDPRHAGLCHYLTHPPASHWHLGVHSGGDQASDEPSRSDRKAPLLGLVSGFMIPDPQPGPQGGPQAGSYSRTSSGAGRQATQRAAFFINSLIIAPHLRRQGLGRVCVEALGRLARARGAVRLYLALSHFNLTALPFYQRQGFHPSALVYWSLSPAGTLRSFQQLQSQPLMLHRSQAGVQPGLVRLSHPAGQRMQQPAPPVDLGFGYDFGLDAWEAWISPPALADPAAWQGQVYALALRQLQRWHAAQGWQGQVAPKFGLTGLSPRIPDAGEAAEARVLHLDLS